jgi:hypothetical protein
MALERFYKSKRQRNWPTVPNLTILYIANLLFSMKILNAKVKNMNLKRKQLLHILHCLCKNKHTIHSNQTLKERRNNWSPMQEKYVTNSFGSRI